MAEKLTTRMRWLLKQMREQNAQIVEERADEVSRFYLVRRSPQPHEPALAEVTEALLDKLFEAGLVKDMRVGWYDPDRQRWSQPAEVFDLAERWEQYAQARVALQNRLNDPEDDESRG